MGEKPAIFTGNCTKADDFIEEVKAYFRVNQDITRFNSPIKKVAFTLTLIQRDEVAGWVKDMGTWIDGLDHVNQNFPIVWTQFLDEFETQFQDLNKQQRTRMALDKCRMQWPHISQYISNFEKYAQQADTPKATLKQPTCSSKDFPPEYWQMYSNLRTLRDMKIPNKKQSTPLNPSSYSMPLFLLNEAAALLKIVEIEEICLRALQHLLEKMHRIARSSSKTEEEDGTVTNDSGKEEEDKGDKDSSDPSSTLPTHHDG